MNLSRRKLQARAILGISIMAMMAGAMLPGSAVADSPHQRDSLDQIPADVVAAVAESGHMSLARAKSLLETQPDKVARLRRAVDALAGHDAGAWIDESTATPMVNVLNERAAATARAEGVTARVVKHTLADLNNAKDGLDKVAKAKGAGRVAWWRVDIPTNTLVVGVHDGAKDEATAAFVDQAHKTGMTVRVESTGGGQPAPTANIHGGSRITSTTSVGCTAGFNVYDRWGGMYVLTAGHCGGYLTSWRISGSDLGTMIRSDYPGDDMGLILNQQPWVNLPQGSFIGSGGAVQRLAGRSSEPVGSWVCKSGASTGWTCGTIRATNVSVYLGSSLVTGLVETNTCSERGDSGGPNVVYFRGYGYYAQGMSSASVLWPLGGANVCGQKANPPQPNRAWYQPIGEALERYSVTLLTS